jgi:filamentous hemagglutinin family protein
MDKGAKVLKRRFWRVLAWSVGAAVNVLTAGATAQQFTSNITADGTLGTRVMPTSIPGGTQYDINGGKIAGSNQFHSFTSFGVGTGDVASFNGPAGIENVISRVTGGSLSAIDGTIASTVSGANVFLLNPAGAMFGPNAQIDVPGSFHVSTADYVRLGDGGAFFADPGRDSVLTTAPPTAFGFLTTSPGPLTVAGRLQVDSGQTLSLTSGDITVVGGELVAPGGRIRAISNASAGEVALDGNPDGFDAGGHMRFDQGALLDTRGDSGGTIQIRAGRLEMVGAVLDADNLGNTLPARGIDVVVEGEMVVDGGSRVAADVFAGGAGGNIAVRAGSLEVANFSEIRTITDGGSSGAGGDISLAVADRVVMRDGGNVRAVTLNNAAGGDVTVNTPQLEVRDRGYVATVTGFGNGEGGDIRIATTDATLSATKTPGFLTGVVSQTAGAGTGGDIYFNSSGTLRIENGAELSAFVSNIGAGGDLDVDAGIIEIRGIDDPNIFTGIFANVFSAGGGGDLSIQSDTLNIERRGTISASAFWTGDSGHLSINSASLIVRDASLIAASSLFSAGGSSSGMTIDADSIYIEGRTDTAEPFTTDFTGLTTTAGYRGGDAGDLVVTAEEMRLTSRASVSASSYGAGQAGQVVLLVDDLVVQDGSSVLSTAFGAGGAGGIRIEADTVRVAGVNPELFVDITGSTAMAPSGIAAQSGLQGGGGGSISVQAREVALLDGGVIATNTFGAGDSGDIGITAESVLVSGINSEMATFLEAKGASPDEARSALKSGTASAFLREATTGNGGGINVVAREVAMTDGGMISASTTGPGLGGDVHLTSFDIRLKDGALVTAQSQLTPYGSSVLGDGGDITILATDRVTVDNSSVSASSDGQGFAGDIVIDGGRTVELIGGSVSTESVVSDGGDIKVEADALVYLFDGRITTSVVGAGGTGGNIDIDPTFVVLQGGSQVIANATNPLATQAGNIYISGDYILISQDSRVQASGPTNAQDGEIIIRGPDGDLVRVLAQLPESYLEAAGLLKGGCGVGRAGISALVLAGRGGVPVSPDDYLPSFNLGGRGEENGQAAARPSAPGELVALGPRDPSSAGWLLADRACQ